MKKKITISNQKVISSTYDQNMNPKWCVHLIKKNPWIICFQTKFFFLLILIQFFVVVGFSFGRLTHSAPMQQFASKIQETPGAGSNSTYFVHGQFVYKGIVWLLENTCKWCAYCAWRFWWGTLFHALIDDNIKMACHFQ